MHFQSQLTYSEHKTKTIIKQLEWSLTSIIQTHSSCTHSMVSLKTHNHLCTPSSVWYMYVETMCDILKTLLYNVTVFIHNLLDCKYQISYIIVRCMFNGWQIFFFFFFSGFVFIIFIHTFFLFIYLKI